MLRRNVLLAAIVAVAATAGTFLWPEAAGADVGVRAGFGGGFGHAGVAGRTVHGGVTIQGGLRTSLGDFGRPGASYRARGHARQGAMLGNRFLVYQRARLTGRALPAAVPIGDAELIAQRRRLNQQHLGHDRRFYRRGGYWATARRSAYADAYYPYYLLPTVPYGYGAGAPVIIIQAPPPAPAATAAPAAPPARSSQPLDPRGHIKVVGEAERATDAWSEGDVLPDGVPQVTLDYAAYGLPVPPLGEKYARVGNDVLRIDAGTRRITQVVAR